MGSPDPLIIILEGVNGSGKTTLAVKLSEQLRLPVLRPWRDVLEAAKHGKCAQQTELGALGVQINTHVEDLHAADILARLGSSAIMDRSAPSAYAYNTMTPEDGRRMLHWWANRLSIYRGRVLLIWLDVSNWEEVVARCEQRQAPNSPKREDFDRIQARFEVAINVVSATRTSNLSVIKVDTFGKSVQQVHTGIEEWLKKWVKT